MPSYAKTPLEVAAEIYGFNPMKLGDTHLLRFVFPSVVNGTTSAPVNITMPGGRPRLLLALGTSPSDGAPASYAGLSVQFRYGDRDFATDGKAPQFVPFSLLAGRGPGPSQAGGPWYTWEVPPMLPIGCILTATVKNDAAGPLTPSVAVKLVEIQ